MRKRVIQVPHYSRISGWPFSQRCAAHSLDIVVVVTIDNVKKRSKFVALTYRASDPERFDLLAVERRRRINKSKKFRDFS